MRGLINGIYVGVPWPTNMALEVEELLNYFSGIDLLVSCDLGQWIEPDTYVAECGAEFLDDGDTVTLKLDRIA